MIWPFHTKASAKYWLKVFLLYAAFEAGIQLLFFFTLNTFQSPPISDLQFHFIMWVFQCLLIWPIWYVAFAFRRQQLWVQFFLNTGFFILYTFFWYGIVQDWIAGLHAHLLRLTTLPSVKSLKPPVDSWDYFNYQVLKHIFRLGWFFVAAFFYYYKKEEKQRLQLAVANRELQLNLVKWHLNPDFYFKTLANISARAKSSPKDCSTLILTLSSVMEYVIYRSKEKFIPVEEELSFLHNYIYMQNLDKNRCDEFSIHVSGIYNNLLIIPLLLVTLVENRIQSETISGISSPVIDISFESRNMRVNIYTGRATKTLNSIKPGESLLMRLEEFYKKRYRFTLNQENEPWFEMQLNEIA